jgi:hypothetical protein
MKVLNKEVNLYQSSFSVNSKFAIPNEDVRHAEATVGYQSYAGFNYVRWLLYPNCEDIKTGGIDLGMLNTKDAIGNAYSLLKAVLSLQWGAKNTSWDNPSVLITDEFGLIWKEWEEDEWGNTGEVKYTGYKSEVELYLSEHCTFTPLPEESKDKYYVRYECFYDVIMEMRKLINSSALAFEDDYSFGHRFVATCLETLLYMRIPESEIGILLEKLDGFQYSESESGILINHVDRIIEHLAI